MEEEQVKYSDVNMNQILEKNMRVTKRTKES